MNFKDIHNVYLIGIGGIGMSALARYFKHIGKVVGGYDRTSTELTQALEAEGMLIHYEDDIQQVPSCFLQSQHTLVIYTPAIKQLSEWNYFRQNGFSIYKRSQVLGEITRQGKCLAVAGTHGKTTTSSILAHILVESGVSVSAFLGGIAENFDSNFVYRGTDFTVVEADEFDRSFLQLSPDVACITSTDADHLDIYGDISSLQTAFNEFSTRVKPGGRVLVYEDVDIKGITYGFSDRSKYRVQNVRIEKGGYLFDIHINSEIYKDVRFTKPGKHNLLNALAAFSIAVEAGFSPESLVRALSTFKGVRRRFSYVINTEKCVMIDDYAHHPSEINALHQAVREMYPDRKITIIFQPHLFSRTRDFMEEFAVALSQFDTVILYDIYPAREEPIEGISSRVLWEKITALHKFLFTKSEAEQWVRQHRPDLLLMVGAGDISFEVERIKKAMKQ